MRFNKEIIPILIAAFSLVISIISFIFGTFPQLNVFNDNRIDKANAGDDYSQIFLANHYFEVGDISQSLYWYKIAAMSNGKYKGISSNNIAYIYLNYDNFQKEAINYYDKSAELFKNAGKLGEKSAIKNLYLLLISNPSQVFDEINYEKLLDWTKNELEKNHMFTDALKNLQTNWEFKETVYNAKSIPKDTEILKFDLIGSNYSYNGTNGFSWIYTYNIYERVDKLKKEMPKIEYLLYSNKRTTEY